MNQTRPIIWKRRDRLRIRALSRADLAALRGLLERPRTALRSLERPLEGPDRRRLLDAQPTLQLAIERGHQIIGAALATSTGMEPAFGAHPWTQLDDVPQAPPIVLQDIAKGAHLRGMGLFWRDVLDEQAVAEMLTLCRKGLVQQFGYASFYSVVEAAGFADWRSVLMPAAYVQQVHAGSIDDPVVSIWLRQGFEVWGWREVEGALQVVMRWENRAR